MIKNISNGMLPTVLDIKTKDGKQIFYGEVFIHNGFVDKDNVNISTTMDQLHHRYICNIEVQ